MLDVPPVTLVGKPFKPALRAEATREAVADAPVDIPAVTGVRAAVEDFQYVAVVGLARGAAETPVRVPSTVSPSPGDWNCYDHHRLAGLLVVAFAALGSAKLAAVPAMRAKAERRHQRLVAYRRIGFLEVLAALGLIVGAFVSVIGALAAWAHAPRGAVVAHLRNGDGIREIALAVVLGLVTLCFLLLVVGDQVMSRSQRTSVDPDPRRHRGAGPVGATAATLLGQYGVDCLVLDRWDGVYLAATGRTRTTRSTGSCATRSPSSSPLCPGPPAGCSWSTGTTGCSRLRPGGRPRPASGTRRRTCSTSPSSST